MRVKGINLVPEDILRQERLSVYKTGLRVIAVLYVVIVAIIYMNQKMTLDAKSSDEQSLIKQRDGLVAMSLQYSELSKRFTDIQKSEDDIKKRLSISGDLSLKRISWAALLKRMSRDIPANVWLKSLSTSDASEAGGKKIRFTGSAASNKGVSDLVFTLENAGYFHDVQLVYAQKREGSKDSLYDFEVIADVKRIDDILHD
ncbi:MAG: PilN domain-containing protein [Deltaproteobacteria bacterium]|nr:PilN domain-containing protein [Deltaproteobacteria bacterium]